MKHLFPSLKSCHTFFGFHRVYGMQNDRLDLTIILAEKEQTKNRPCLSEKTDLNRTHLIQCSACYNLRKLTQVRHRLSITDPNRTQIDQRSGKPGLVEGTAYEFKKKKVSFSWTFHFSLIDFSQKISDFFFSQMPDAFGVCGTMYKVKKEENLFWGDSQLPSQNARNKSETSVEGSNFT